MMWHELGQLIFGIYLIFVKQSLDRQTPTSEPAILTSVLKSTPCPLKLENPLFCDARGFCQCCLENGTSVTDTPSLLLKTCTCAQDRAKAKLQKNFGHFVPKCDEDGSFSKKQFHSNGRWWCADPITGEKLTEQQKGDEGKIKYCDCLTENRQSKNKAGFGHFLPKCEEDGSYSVVQRHSSIRKWWCADPLTGKKIIEPQSENEGPIKFCNCLLSKYRSEHHISILGSMMPKCEADGSFNLTQYWPSTGLSWCVEPINGENITVPSRIPLVSCKCPLEKREAKSKLGFGHFIPKCSNDGSYLKIQVHSSIKKWWCADPLTGEKVTGPQADNEDSKKNCECLVLKHQAEKQSSLGTFTPKCNEDGLFSEIQIHSSTGLGWCADPATGRNVTVKTKKPPAHCACFLQALNEKEKKIVGNHIPACESDGLYAKLQRWGSTGLSWCADPLTGKNLTTHSKEDIVCN